MAQGKAGRNSTRQDIARRGSRQDITCHGLTRHSVAQGETWLGITQQSEA
jgi:hypothetical protein